MAQPKGKSHAEKPAGTLAPGEALLVHTHFVRYSRRGDVIVVKMPGPDGRIRDRRVPFGAVARP